ncbi:MAG: hypothetical protein R3242_08125 [Akkermansiaceae bacterium]|nr:hypothetical protein [Akkermansiaceae bacterium]
MSLLLAACATGPHAIPGPAARVSRAEAMQIAEAYASLQWAPTEANVLHGPDADGIHVLTPDEGLARLGHIHGWWKSGKTNTGMPYQWGGFDTPQHFLDKLKQGHAAGDIATAEKRRLDDAAVSRHACGIDCSGLVSRCWRLARHTSTDELARLCVPLKSIWMLQPGDILLKPGHVLLVQRWDPIRDANVLVYEATLKPKWRVHRTSKSLREIEAHGYQPLRYRKMAE